MLRLPALCLAVALLGCSTAQLRSACVGAGVADAASTAVGIKSGAVEANPVLKPAPALGVVALTGITVIVAEAALKAGHEKAARWLYGVCAAVHGGSAAWNAGQVSK